MKNLLNKFQKQTNLSTQILIIISILLVINFLSYQIFTRFDLTEGKIYSISKISKEAVGNLEDIINIKVYFSDDLPPQYMAVRQEVEDILAEYQNYANNKLSVEFIDPKDDEDLALELQMLGIPKLQFNVLENDKYEVIGGYMGIAAEYGDKKQAIPVVNNTRNLEYQLTSTIKKVTAENIPTIAFSSGHGEWDQNEDTGIISQKLGEIYTIRTVDLSAVEEIPEDVNTFIINGPKEAFNDRQMYLIDQFIMRGNSVIFLIDGVNIDDSLIANVNQGSLEKLLASYGAKVEPYFVLDTSNDMASFSQGFMTFTTEYPFFVKVASNGLNQEAASVAKLQNLIFPWTSPVTINLNKNSEAEIKTLAMTTKDAWLMKEDFTLQPQGTFGYYADPEQYALVAMVSGKVNSAFSSFVPGEDGKSGEHISSAENARIIIVGDSNFTKDNFMNRYPDDATFMQNIVDSISLDGDLIKIRSKDVAERPLDKIEDSEKNSIRIFNIFGITVIVLAFGILRYYQRKKSKFADEL
ncbi:MAG: GldG family protein [Patescibacteria group bacterium]|jgi:gliding-associated putative ABC transporter substrate-binding component GldG